MFCDDKSGNPERKGTRVALSGAWEQAPPPNYHFFPLTMTQKFAHFFRLFGICSLRNDLMANEKWEKWPNVYLRNYKKLASLWFP
jgi:hypothetical protein